LITELSVEAEQALIKLAKSGDNESARTLLKQYSPALKAASNKNAIYLDQNERDSACQGAFVEALHAFNPAKHSRLAAVIKNKLLPELAYEKSTSETLSVPDRTIRRYHLIMNKAGDDIFKALELAPKNDMNASTFLQVHNILRNSARLEEFDLGGLESASLVKAPTEAPEAVKQQVKAVFEALGDDTDLLPIEVQVLSVHHGLAGNNNSEQKSFEDTSSELGLPVKEIKSVYRAALAKAKLRLSHSN